MMRWKKKFITIFKRRERFKKGSSKRSKNGDKKRKIEELKKEENRISAILEKIYKRMNVKIKNKRDAKIVTILNTGKYTLQEVGDMYGITKERVRQIYKKATGKGVNFLRLQRGIAKRKAWFNEIVLVCQGCGTLVKRKDRRRGQRKFCRKCRYIQIVLQRDPAKLKICEYCKEPFHPFRSVEYTYSRNKNRFCSYKHYRDWMRKTKIYPHTYRKRNKGGEKYEKDKFTEA